MRYALLVRIDEIAAISGEERSRRTATKVPAVWYGTIEVRPVQQM